MLRCFLSSFQSGKASPVPADLKQCATPPVPLLAAIPNIPEVGRVCRVIMGGCGVIMGGCGVIRGVCGVIMGGCGVIRGGCGVIMGGCRVIMGGCRVIMGG